MRLILFLSLIQGIAVLQVESQINCGDFIELPLTNEDADEIVYGGCWLPGVYQDEDLLWNPINPNVIKPKLTPGEGVNEDNTLLTFEIDLKFKDFVDIDPRKLEFGAELGYTGSSNTIIVGLLLNDINNRPPKFNATGTVGIKIPTNWVRSVPINWNNPLLTTDQDYTETNANLILSSNPDVLEFEKFQQWVSGGDGSTYKSYDWVVYALIKDKVDLNEKNTIVVTAYDGVNSETVTIQLDQEIVNLYAPEFDQTKYYETLNAWPKEGETLTSFVATDPDVASTGIIYTLVGTGLDDYIEIDETNLLVRFKRDIYPGDPGVPPFVVAEIQATENIATEPRTTLVPLIIEFPKIPERKSNPVFDQTYYKAVSEFISDTEDSTATLPIPYKATTEEGESITYEILGPGADYAIVYNDGPGPAVKFQKPVTEDSPSDEIYFNKVLLLQISASVEGDSTRKDTATIVIQFPEKELISTTPSEPCPTTGEPPIDTTTNCPVCPSPSTFNPITDGTTASEPCPITCNPITDCPVTSEPVTCPATSEPVTCPTTCDPITDCPPTSEPVTCPTTCDPSTDCPPTSEPVCPTTWNPITDCPPTSEPVTCPTTCDPSTVCPPTSEPVTCPTTCDPSTDCPTPEPSTGTCTPCDTVCTTLASSASCPTCPTCSPSTGTCPPCNTQCPPTGPPVQCPTTSTPSMCPDCPTTPSSDCLTPKPEACASTGDSNTGMIAGIAVVSVLFACSAGVAGYLFLKLRKVASSPMKNAFADPPTRKSFSNGRNMRASFAEPDTGVGRSYQGFSNSELPSGSGGQLQEVLTHPVAEPVASTSANAATVPLSTTPAVKSAMAAPKEIAPDYDGGVTNPANQAASKPRSIQIADEVEIIDNKDEPIAGSDSEDERL